MSVASVERLHVSLPEELVKGQRQHRVVDIFPAIVSATEKVAKYLNGFKLAEVMVLSELSVFPGKGRSRP